MLNINDALLRQCWDSVKIGSLWVLFIYLLIGAWLKCNFIQTGLLSCLVLNFLSKPVFSSQHSVICVQLSFNCICYIVKENGAICESFLLGNYLPRVFKAFSGSGANINTSNKIMAIDNNKTIFLGQEKVKVYPIMGNGNSGSETSPSHCNNFIDSSNWVVTYVFFEPGVVKLFSSLWATFSKNIRGPLIGQVRNLGADTRLGLAKKSAVYL